MVESRDDGQEVAKDGNMGADAMRVDQEKKAMS
jgi:hypothetical protein